MPPILSRTKETLVLVIVSVRAPSCAQPSASVGPREHAAFSQSAAGARVLSIARTPLRCEVLSCPSGRLIGFLPSQTCAQPPPCAVTQPCCLYWEEFLACSLECRAVVLIPVQYRSLASGALLVAQQAPLATEA